MGRICFVPIQKNIWETPKIYSSADKLLLGTMNSLQIKNLKIYEI
jgi:hypothetical protein